MKFITDQVEKFGFVPFLVILWVLVLTTIVIVWVLIQPEQLGELVPTMVLGLFGIVGTIVATVVVKRKDGLTARIKRIMDKE